MARALTAAVLGLALCAGCRHAGDSAPAHRAEPSTPPAPPPDAAQQTNAPTGGAGAPHEPAAAQRPAAEPAASPRHLRPANHAGSWYPAAPQALGQAIDAALDGAPPPSSKPQSGERLLAIVSPHAGLRFSGRVAAASHATLRRRPIRRIFLLGPSHHVPFSGVALPPADMDGYATPLGPLPFDRTALDALRGQPGFRGPPRAHLPEHSLEMNAIFLARVLPGVHIVPLVVGSLGDDATVRAIASRLRALLRDGDVVVISSDFTHYGPRYGYQPPGKSTEAIVTKLAEEAQRALEAVDLAAFDAHLQRTHDTICGREPLRILLALLPEGSRGVRIARDTSGHITGDWTNSVTYVAMAFYGRAPWGVEPGARGGRARGQRAQPPPPGAARTASAERALVATLRQGPQVLDEAGQRLALRMARKTLEIYLREHRKPDAAELGVPPTGPFHQKLGTFVTLEKHGRLRGCIGHIFPVEELWQDIRDNAIHAAVHDRRFRPVTADELDELEIEISILTVPKQVGGPGDIVIGRDGVVLRVANHSAVYLPQVAPEQHWDVAQTLSHLSRKAGLPMDAWKRPDAVFLTFQAQVFNERDAGLL